jgi:hypothetical protein
LTVSDLARSRAFYARLMPRIGYPAIWEYRARQTAWGSWGTGAAWLKQAPERFVGDTFSKDRVGLTRLAFRAEAASVDALARGSALGGAILTRQRYPNVPGTMRSSSRIRTASSSAFDRLGSPVGSRVSVVRKFVAATSPPAAGASWARRRRARVLQPAPEPRPGRGGAPRAAGRLAPLGPAAPIRLSSRCCRGGCFMSCAGMLSSGNRAAADRCMLDGLKAIDVLLRRA